MGLGPDDSAPEENPPLEPPQAMRSFLRCVVLGGLCLGLMAGLGCESRDWHSEDVDPFEALLKQYQVQGQAQWDFSAVVIRPEHLERLAAVDGSQVRGLRFGPARLDQLPKLEFLARFPQLEELYLGQVPLSAQAMPQVAQLTQLRVLNAEQAPIDDPAMQHLGKLEHLELLRLCRAQIGARGLMVLRDLKGLRALILDEVPLDRPALEVLKQLRQLESLYLFRTGVPEDELVELQHFVPHVHW